MGLKVEDMRVLFEKFSKSVMGMGPKDIFGNMKELGGLKFQGITSSKNLEILIEEIAKERNMVNIKDIKMPICIPTTDLISDKEYVFTNNKNAKEDYYIKDFEISKAVRASSTFPFIYSPFEYEKYQFVDGGIFDNLPVQEVRKLEVDKVIAIKFNLKNPVKQNTIYNIALQSVDLMTENLIKESVDQSDAIIDINLREVKAFSIKKIDFCYEEGYKQTLSKILEVKRNLGII